ncbi:MAG: hypothetical protein ACK4QL_07815 [Pseudanabaenaceae cyanobacterium]
MDKRFRETKILIATLLVSLTLVVVGTVWFWQTLTSQSPTEVASGYAKTFAEVKDVPKGLFNYGGSTIWAPSAP